MKEYTDELNGMLKKQCAWLRGGDDTDIVISSRIRLARNINGYPFVNRASEEELKDLQDMVIREAGKVFRSSSVFYADLRSCSDLDRNFLLERQLISKELAYSELPCAAVIDQKETFSIMINEEDHLRIQTMVSGFELKNLWKTINKLDDRLEKVFSYAFDSKLGYLTACPSNLGTGIRVSVMLHLPGLVETGEVEKVLQGIRTIHLTVRGLFGEGTSPLGEFFQISNQTTLGRCEEELINEICDIVPEIIEYERRAQSYLLENNHEKLLDKCFRALGILQTARTISIEEALEHLSSIRLGIHLKLIEDVSCSDINDLFLHIQSAHLMKKEGKRLTEDEENIVRANCLRKQLAPKPDKKKKL
ncbi:MAG: protein arginine kinase [Planctomycetia bacterium]|nr:protein arginine kinase [Planctomycetia bacterium]